MTREISDRNVDKINFGIQLNKMKKELQNLIEINSKLKFETQTLSNQLQYTKKAMAQDEIIAEQNNFYANLINTQQESARIANLKNEIYTKRNNLTNGQLKLSSNDIHIGFLNKPGINFGRPLFLGPRNGIHFQNRYNNKSYVSQSERMNAVFFNV